MDHTIYFNITNDNATKFENETKSTNLYIDGDLTTIASTWIVLALLGFCGNTLMFLMTNNQSIRDSSYACYLSVLSVTDSLVLWIKLMHGGALLALPSVKPHGPLIGFANTTFSCVLTGLELCARCTSAWVIGKSKFSCTFLSQFQRSWEYLNYPSSISHYTLLKTFDFLYLFL